MPESGAKVCPTFWPRLLSGPFFWSIREASSPQIEREQGDEQKLPGPAEIAEDDPGGMNAHHPSFPFEGDLRTKFLNILLGHEGRSHTRVRGTGDAA